MKKVFGIIAVFAAIIVSSLLSGCGDKIELPAITISAELPEKELPFILTPTSKMESALRAETYQIAEEWDVAGSLAAVNIDPKTLEKFEIIKLRFVVKSPANLDLTPMKNLSVLAGKSYVKIASAPIEKANGEVIFTFSDGNLMNYVEDGKLSLRLHVEGIVPSVEGDIQAALFVKAKASGKIATKN